MGLGWMAAKSERKQRLRELVLKSGCKELIYAQHIETQGIAFFD